MTNDEIHSALESFLHQLTALKRECDDGYLTKSRHNAELSRIKNAIPRVLVPDSRPFHVFQKGLQQENPYTRMTIGTYADEHYCRQTQSLIAILNRVIAEVNPTHEVQRQGEFIVEPGQTTRGPMILIEVLSRAKQSVAIIDKHLDHSILNYLESVNPSLTVRLLAEDLNSATKLLLGQLQTGYPKVDLRLSSGFHDRFVVADASEVWSFGSSLKDLGKEASHVKRIDDGGERERLITLFEKYWASARPV